LQHEETEPASVCEYTQKHIHPAECSMVYSLYNLHLDAWTYNVLASLVTVGIVSWVAK